MHKLRAPLSSLVERTPPALWLVVSAVFHYLGPAFAVLLFPHVGVLGIAWFRIVAAATLFAFWSRPWSLFQTAPPEARRLILALGACLAAMNTCFYLAIDRLPLSMVATIEFAGVIAVAAYGLRTARNLGALGLATVGVVTLTQDTWSQDRLGLLFAVLNATLFAVYIVLGHRLAEDGAGDGVKRLAVSMAAACIFIFPVGIGEAAAAFATPLLVAAGVGVGICSSVIPYVCDQLAMARLPRNTFALLLALLPAVAVVVGALVLLQIPSSRDLLGVSLVMLGILAHRPSKLPKTTATARGHGREAAEI